MGKAEFLERIKARIAHLPYADLRKHLDFYAEMIEDRMEEGLSEEEAIATMEPPETIAEKILEEAEPEASAENPSQEPTPGEGSRMRKLFLPLGILLIIAVIVVHFVAICIIGCAVGFSVACVWAAVKEGLNSALIMGGAMLICTGLFLFLLPACGALRRAVSRTMGWITGKNNKEVTEE